MLRLLAALVLALDAAAIAAAAPVEVRLSPDAANAAIEAGADANRAADALNAARAEPRLALPGERDGSGTRGDRKIHGEVGAGIGTGGAREAFGEINAPLGANGSADFVYDYNQFGRAPRRRY